VNLSSRNYPFGLGYHLDTLIIWFQKTGYQIEILKIGGLKMKKGQIRASGSTLSGCGIF